MLGKPEVSAPYAVITFEVVDVKKTRHVLGHIRVKDLTKERSEELRVMYGTLEAPFPFPLTTALVRVMALPENMLNEESVRIPSELSKSPYHAGLYSTSSCEPTEGDIKMFHSLTDMPQVRCTKVIPESTLQEILGNTEKILPTTLLDTSYVCDYDGSEGFVLSLEGIHGIPPEAKSMLKVVVEISPPSHFSLKQKELQYVYCTLMHDWSSDITCPLFDDDPYIVTKVPFYPHAVMIFHVYQVPSCVPLCFGIFQIFRPPSFLRNGRFAIPLFKGAPPRQLIHELTTSPVAKILSQWLAKKTLGIVPVHSACLYFSLYDRRRNPLRRRDGSDTRCVLHAPSLPIYDTTGFEMAGQPMDHVSTPWVQPEPGQHRPLRTLCRDNVKVADFQIALNRKFIEAVVPGYIPLKEILMKKEEM